MSTKSNTGDRIRREPLKKNKSKEKERSNKLKLDESEANKTLYICYIEQHRWKRVSYAVRSISLSDLLMTSSSSASRLRQVAYKAGDDDLPSSVGIGLLGSRIVFAAGITPATDCPIFGTTTWRTDVYAFETDPEKRRQGDNNNNNNEMIKKMDAKLVHGKFIPRMVVLGGTLCALSFRFMGRNNSFEAFDSETGTWSALPEPPYLERYPSTDFGYAITGTKIFISSITSPVYCFDIAHPYREWRRVDSMCQGGPFPFIYSALVLDLPGGDLNSNKKLVFGYSDWKLGVYIMFLDENRESIFKIADWKLPMLPPEFKFACISYLVHIGCQKACLVVPLLRPYQDELEQPHRFFDEDGSKTKGVAIPFQFQVDVTKIDKDPKNSVALQFMPTSVFEFYNNPSTFSDPDPFGCFLL